MGCALVQCCGLFVGCQVKKKVRFDALLESGSTELLRGLQDG